MTGTYVTVATGEGGEFKAYVSLPETGRGPGIVLLQDISGVNPSVREVADDYAEEGYVVIAPDLSGRIEPGIELDDTQEDHRKARAYHQEFDTQKSVEDIAATVTALRALPQHAGKVGALGFRAGGKLAYLAAARTDIDCAVGYCGVGIEQVLDEADKITCPMALHFAGEDKHVPTAAVKQVQGALAGRDEIEIYVYAGADQGFSAKSGNTYDKPSARMAHSRSIALFRKVMGPHYNLSALWDKHCEYEFATRDADATMATMVASPYVNHIPTMTGGVGYEDLHRFYQNHFIPKTPADTKLIPISRTIGADRLVDEMLFCFTHDIEIDWMLPGLEPTGKYVEVPLVAIVCFRGDKLYNEHIYWDQASVLVQIGLLDASLLPVAGIETAKKLVDETQPSNTLMKRWAESAPQTAEQGTDD